MVDYRSGSIDFMLDGKSLLTEPDLQFLDFEIYYAYHEIPRLTVSFFGSNYNDLVTNNDFTLKASFSNGDSYSIPFYVMDIKQNTPEDGSGTVTKLIGFTCKLEFMKTSKTQYLGSDLKSAIETVCGELDTSSLGKVNVPGEFYQINETDYQCLLRLLKGVSGDNNWSISESAINLIDPNSVEEVDLYLAGDLVHNVVSADESEPIVDEGVFETQGWYRNQHIESNSPDYVRNALKAASKMQSYENMYPMTYKGMLSTPVGTKIKMKTDVYRLEKYDVVSKTLKCNQQEVETSLILGVNNG